MINKKLLIATVGFLFMLVFPAIAQDIVVPADSEDVNAFDQAISESKYKYSEQKKNAHTGEETQNQHRYMEQKQNGNLGEGEKVKSQYKEQNKNKEEGDETKNKHQYTEQKKKKLIKQKGKTPPTDSDAIVSEETEKMKKVGEEQMNQYRERERNEYRQGETNGAVNSYGPESTMGSKNVSDVIPDPGKRPDSSDPKGPSSEQGNQGGK